MKNIALIIISIIVGIIFILSWILTPIALLWHMANENASGIKEKIWRRSDNWSQKH